MDEVTHKKLAALDRFMDKMLYASWSGMPVVAMALYKALRSEYGYFLDTTKRQDIRGESRGVPDRGRRRRRPGEEAHRGGKSRSWNGAAIAGRERPDQGLEGFQGAGLDRDRDRRETRGEPGPQRDRRPGGARCLRAWTPVRRRLRAAGRVTQDRLALRASYDACRTLRSQGRHCARGRPIALHNTHRPDR